MTPLRSTANSRARRGLPVGLCLALVLLSALPVVAQTVDWVARYAGTGRSTARPAEGGALAFDADGNAYVTGTLGVEPTRTYLTLKLDPSGGIVWWRTYNGTEGGEAFARAITVDGNGNVHVTGSAQSAYATVKYDRDGNLLWAREYRKAGNGSATARALAVDGSGNVYVTGTSMGSGGTLEANYATVKYDRDGNLLWATEYDGTGSNSDWARALALDGTGNVYVTGWSWGVAGRYNYATVKYDSTGNQLWAREYNGSGNHDDSAQALAVDGSGNVYVAGTSRSATGRDNYATVKYDGAGNQLWVREYDGSGNHDDRAGALAVDGSGNVYVTGWSWGAAGRYNSATVKYDSAGNQLWAREYNGTGNGIYRTGPLALDGSGGVYVTGTAQGAAGGLDYATVKYDSDGNQLWVEEYDGTGNDDDAYTLAVDAGGSPCVAGYSRNAEGFDEFRVIAYTPDGTVRWNATHPATSSSDRLSDAAVGADGSVYLAGGTGILAHGDFLTVKVDAAGVVAWARTYNGTGNNLDFARGIAVDGSGNVYVTGESWSSPGAWNYATVKYDSAGNQLWARTYNGTGNWDDRARALAVDASGHVYVTGSSDGATGAINYATVKYDGAGNQLWAREYDGAATYDYAIALAVDGSGNVVVTGSSRGVSDGYRIATVKYDTAGDQLWAKVYDGTPTGDDVATSLAVDGSGNVYVAGWSRGATGATNYVTVKYDSEGNLLWAKEYNGTGNADDYAFALAVDGNGSVYVTGLSAGATGGVNYATVKYDSAGNALWAVEYRGAGDGDDIARSLAVDGSGNVYVTGSSRGATGRIDLATIKYDGDGHEQWAAVFDGPLSGPDRTSRVLIDPAGRAIVAATQVGPDGTDDFLAIRYAEGGGPPFCTPSATTACLQDGRFEVTVEYRTQTGSGPGQVMEFAGARTENTDSVFYWFFTPTNYEMGLKVLDACVPALGNRYWVFVSGLTDQGWRVTVRDTATGLTRDYTNELGVLSRTFADTETFGCATGGASGPQGEAGAIGPGARALGVALADLWAAEAAAARAARAEASGVEAGTCERTATTGCLQNGRFEVRSAYQTGTGGGEAQVMSFGGQRAENVDSVFYTFFTPTNFEMGLKVLDACIPSLGNNFWVFGSGLTDQGWTVTVRDTVAGGERTYTNPVGSLSQTFLDATAFPCD